MTSVSTLVCLIEKLISNFSRNQQRRRTQIVQLYRLNFGVIDAELPMHSGTVEAHQNTQVHTEPIWVQLATIGTEVVPRNFLNFCNHRLRQVTNCRLRFTPMGRIQLGRVIILKNSFELWLTCIGFLGFTFRKNDYRLYCKIRKLRLNRTCLLHWPSVVSSLHFPPSTYTVCSVRPWSNELISCHLTDGRQKSVD